MFNFLNKTRYAVRSPKWSSVRKEHLKNHPRCAACGRNKKLEVHHIIPVHIDPSLELDPSNLMTMCADPCHIVFGHLMNFRSWNFFVVADTERYLDKIHRRIIRP